MTTPSTYNMLLNIPVFQGMGKLELQDIIAHSKLGFEKYEPGTVIQNVGDTCQKLCFLMNGTIAVTAWADDKSYAVTEDIDTPYIIEPERLCGLDNHCKRRVVTLTTCNVMALDKTEVTKMLDKYAVFRLNLLNLISTNAQRTAPERWQTAHTDIQSRLKRFVAMRCTQPKGTKHLAIKRSQLVTELNMGLQNLTKALHEMQRQGLIKLGRATYDIPELDKL